MQRKFPKSEGSMSRRQTLAALAGAGAFFIPAWNESVEAADAIVCVPTTPRSPKGRTGWMKSYFDPISAKTRVPA